MDAASVFMENKNFQKLYVYRCLYLIQSIGSIQSLKQDLHTLQPME